MWSLMHLLGYISLIIPSSLTKVLWRLLDIFDGRVGAALRYILVCKRLGACGKNIFISSHVFIDHLKNVYIGNNVSIHRQSTLLAGGGIYIGDNVSIAHNSSLVSGNHIWSDSTLPIKYNKVALNSITIEEDVWIGCGVRILSGVTIASRVIVAAGAVVTKNLYTHSIYGGVPARLIKDINEK